MDDEFEKWRKQIHKNDRGYVMEIIFVVWIAAIAVTAIIGLL